MTLLKLLIEKAEYNAQDENGFTCLHYAAQKNNYEAVYQLINIPGININVIFISLRLFG